MHDRQRDILLVSKRPGLDRWPAAEVDRMIAAGVLDRAGLAEGKATHEAALAEVETALAGEQIRHAYLDAITPELVDAVDLVIAVGGDGTALAVARFLDRTELLAVNSDPNRSVGHYTRCTGNDFADLFAAWRRGDHAIEELARLRLRIGEEERLVLNDCLVCNSNPGSMSIYRLCLDHLAETQQSSGVWVSTASGSTGAIASAGMSPVDAATPSLLYLVREPFRVRKEIELARGIQQPPSGLRIVAGPPGLAAFVDGDPNSVAIPPGEAVVFDESPLPLRLVTPAASG